MGNNAVEVTLPNTNTVMRFEKAGPGPNGDYEDAYSMRIGIAGAAQAMVDAQKKLNGYASEIEWNAHAVETLQTLSTEIQDWAQTPPNAERLMAAYGAGLAQTTPTKPVIDFAYVLPQLWVDRGYTTAPKRYINDLNVSLPLASTRRVPPEYPTWPQPVEAGKVYARPDGTFFWLLNVPSNPQPAPAPGQPFVEDPTWDTKYTLQEWDIDWNKTTVAWKGDPKTELFPAWTKALGPLKQDLTTQSPTKVAYLQNITEEFNRMFGLFQGLIDSMKKLMESLIR